MGWGRLSPEQRDAIRGVVRGRTVHDLGCGDLELSRQLIEFGATSVIGVDKSPSVWEPIPAGVLAVRATFAEFVLVNPTIDVAFVSWPVTVRDAGLLSLVRAARTVVYLGKCTDGIMCGWPALFQHFLARDLMAYVPHPNNALCVYGGELPKPRAGEYEECAGVDDGVVYRLACQDIFRGASQ